MALGGRHVPDPLVESLVVVVVDEPIDHLLDLERRHVGGVGLVQALALPVAIQDSHVALSVGVRGREKL